MTSISRTGTPRTVYAQWPGVSSILLVRRYNSRANRKHIAIVSVLIKINSVIFLEPARAAAGRRPVHRPRAVTLEDDPSSEGSFSTSLFASQRASSMQRLNME